MTIGPKPLIILNMSINPPLKLVEDKPCPSPSTMARKRLHVLLINGFLPDLETVKYSTGRQIWELVRTESPPANDGQYEASKALDWTGPKRLLSVRIVPQRLPFAMTDCSAYDAYS